MTDHSLNRFVAQGTAAQRAAFTPSPPTPASGPSQGYVWYETDTGLVWAWYTGGSDWVQLNTPVFLGSGAPSTLKYEGALYIDDTASPAALYVQHSGAWHAVGASGGGGGGGGGGGSPAYFGTEPIILGTVGTFNGGYGSWSPVFLGAGAVVEDVCWLATVAATTTWYGGLYADNGSGFPGALLAQTAAQTDIAIGVNAAALSSPYTVPTSGLYWIYFGTSNTVNFRALGGGSFVGGGYPTPPSTAPSSMGIGGPYGVFASGTL